MCIIGALFHIMSFAFMINAAKGVSGLMPHVETSVTCNGRPKLECVVLLPVISKGAISLDATVKTI
jgi:hypothetical protein